MCYPSMFIQEIKCQQRGRYEVGTQAAQSHEPSRDVTVAAAARHRTMNVVL